MAERLSISRMSAAASRRSAVAAAVKRPCLKAFVLPTGAPGDAPPCIRQRPFVIAGDRHSIPLLVLAPQRGLRCMGKCYAGGCSSDFVRSLPCVSTMPTTACPPAWTYTCSTVTFCCPLPRCLSRAPSRAVHVRDNSGTWQCQKSPGKSSGVNRPDGNGSANRLIASSIWSQATSLASSIRIY